MYESQEDFIVGIVVLALLGGITFVVLHFLIKYW